MIVRENLNFERHEDPFKNLGIGMDAKLEQFKKDHSFGPSVSKNYMLSQAVRDKRSDLIIYMLDVLNYDVNGGNFSH